MRKLILASASPRRKHLLENLGLQFDIVPPEVEENAPHFGDPEKQALELAKMKARTVAPQYPEAIVLGADTIAVLHGHILGKPSDADHARRILRSLSGTTHRVISAVCAVCFGARAELATLEVSAVYMRPLSDTEINDYVESGEAMGKAGAYALQENADKFARIVSGSFENVVGLPIDSVKKILSLWSNL
jgi:septum formation protein